MRKLMMCLAMSVTVLGLAACTKTTEKVVEQEEVPIYKELKDPRGTTLESTATGESNPQVVETLYETNDVVIADFVPTEMGYAVDPTGETDSTEGIQQALYDCYDTGGGTVYLPAGNYAISDTIYIPPYVTLRGDWQDPDEGTEYGTIISVWMESEDEEGAGAFKMGSCAGALGLTVYYPLQSMDCIMPYPYAFFVEGGAPNNSLATIQNVTIINGYRGIGSNSSTSHEMLQVINVKGTYLYVGLDVSNSADVGNVKSFVVNNKYWKEAAADCMNAVQGSVIDDYTRKYTIGLEIGDLEWTTFNQISVDNCAIGIHTVKGERIDFAGSMSDVNITNCKQGLVIDGLDERWGMNLATSYIEGGIVNNTKGRMKLCDVEIKGEVVEMVEDTIMNDDESDLSGYKIDYEKGYVKPAENFVVAELGNGLFVDASPELQAYIDKIAGEGGGVVYVPGGTYRFRSPLTIPEGVELRGSSSVMTRDHIAMSNGTVFLCYYGDDATDGPEGQAFITLVGKNAGLNGIRIVYPENGAKDEDLHTTYTVRGTAEGVYVVNSMISASAYGIDFAECDNHYIEGVVTCCYYNAFRLGGTGGTITRCLQNGTVMVRTQTVGLQNWLAEATITEDLFDPILRKECDYIIVENAKNQTIYSVFAYGVKTSVLNDNSENTVVNNIGNDNNGLTTPQFYVKSGSLAAVNVLRYLGYSYELEEGEIALYNRLAINEAGEKTVLKSK